jgi:hypothetical protein
VHLNKRGFCRTLRVELFLASSFLCSKAESTPAHLKSTQAVETVEKVTFQKLSLKSGTEMLKSVWFLVFRKTFWQHFGIFLAYCGRFF